jgi:WD40 repeat protein
MINPGTNDNLPEESNRNVPSAPPDVPGYTLIRVIGRGSYGEVWLARNILGTHYAVKIVYRRNFDQHKPYEQEFTGIREFEKVSWLHESQLGIRHVDRNDAGQYFYYVMDLADPAEGLGQAKAEESAVVGGRFQSDSVCVDSVKEPATVAAVLEPSGFDPATYVPRTLEISLKESGRLQFEDCLRTSLGLANALKHLHSHGLVHRDVKPSNIIFVNGIPKLADIGLVTRCDATLSFVGSRGFMPPEGPGRPQGDIYSLGKVMYEMATGQDRLEFPAVPADFLNWPDRDQVNELLAIANKACEPDLNKRYQSIEALLADLILIQAGRSVRRLMLLERGRKWAVLVVVCAVLMSGIGWLAMSANAWHKAEERAVLMSLAQSLRMRERTGGWSLKALDLLGKSAAIRIDEGVGAQVAATLGGVDARVIDCFKKTGANHLAFDAQGRHLIMDGCDGGPVRIFDLKSDNLKYCLSTNTGPVFFDFAGTPLQLIAAKAGVCSLINPETGNMVRQFSLGLLDNAIKEFEPSILTVSADRTHCAGCWISPANRENAHVAVWNMEDGRLLSRFAGPCTALVFSPDNSCLITGDDAGRVRIRSISTFEDVQPAFQQDSTRITCLAIHDDVLEQRGNTNGRNWLLAAGDAGGTIWSFRVSTHTTINSYRASGYGVYSIAFSPDGTTLASAGFEDAGLWDVVTGKHLLKIQAGAYEKAIAYSPSGQELAIGKEHGFEKEGYVTLLKMEPGRGINLLRGFAAQCTHVVFSHDSKHLAALAGNWQVGIWDMNSSSLERVFPAPKGITADNADLLFSKDDRKLIFTTCGVAIAWDLQSSSLPKTWPLPRGLVQQLCFDAEGHMLHFQWEGANSKEGRCKVRDLGRVDYLTPLAEFAASDEAPEDVALSEQGDFVVLARRVNDNKSLEIFSPTNGRPLAGLPGTDAQSPDAFWRNVQTARLERYCLRSKDSVLTKLLGGGTTPREHEVNAASPDKETLATINSDGYGLTLYSLSNLQWKITVGLDQRVENWPRFSPDGKLLAVGVTDGTVVVCNLLETSNQLNRLGIRWH